MTSQLLQWLMLTPRTAVKLLI